MSYLRCFALYSAPRRAARRSVPFPATPRGNQVLPALVTLSSARHGFGPSGVERRNLEVRDLALTGPAPLQLTSLLQESSRQEVAEEPVDLAVCRHLGQAGFPVHCHLHLVVSMPPGVSRNLVTAENVVAELVDHHPSGPNWSADPATLPESWRWKTKMR